MREKEVNDMAVLARPLNLSFEIDEKKVEQFKKSKDDKAFDKAMKRAKKFGYIPSVKKGEFNK